MLDEFFLGPGTYTHRTWGVIHISLVKLGITHNKLYGLVLFIFYSGKSSIPLEGHSNISVFPQDGKKATLFAHDGPDLVHLTTLEKILAL